MKQVDYLVGLGVKPEEANAMTIKEASAKIDELTRKARQGRKGSAEGGNHSTVENICRLPEEYRRLLRKYLSFYHALDRGARAPSSEAQRHFVAVCRGELPPTNSHEFAYTDFKKYCALSGTTEELAAVNDFRFDPPAPPQDEANKVVDVHRSGVPVAGAEFRVYDPAEAWFPRSEHWRTKRRKRRR
jgi:hypothetical protein